MKDITFCLSTSSTKNGEIDSINLGLKWDKNLDIELSDCGNYQNDCRAEIITNKIKDLITTDKIEQLLGDELDG